MNAEDLVITFKRNMAKLSRAERRRAIESVRDVIRAAAFDDAADSAYEVECCPRCGSAAVVKKGKAANGEQRYLCRGCGRTFGMGSGRILGTRKLPKETWMAYAECFVLSPGGRDAVRDEGQDARARRGNDEIACGSGLKRQGPVSNSSGLGRIAPLTDSGSTRGDHCVIAKR